MEVDKTNYSINYEKRHCGYLSEIIIFQETQCIYHTRHKKPTVMAAVWLNVLKKKAV